MEERVVKVSCISVGELGCNCYLLEKESDALLVDPGDEYQKILELIRGKNIKGILITHGHFDHVGCLEQLVSDFSYPVYRYENLKEGQVQIGEFDFEVIYTLGHTKDSISFYFRKEAMMFTGDFLFYDTVGRCDLEGGDYQEMLKSISKIKKYDDDITIYPGHGKKTVLGREKRENIYFKERRM